VDARVHVGTAIARDGDYLGAAINLTARLLGAAADLISAAVALGESLSTNHETEEACLPSVIVAATSWRRSR
jgi:class 3 adenylate cyclase